MDFPICTASEMKAWEARSDASGVSYEQLMENAGTAAAKALEDLAEGRKLLILAGKGNNAGDGFVIARLLANRGFSCKITLLLGTRFSDLAALNLQRLGLDPEVPAALQKERDLLVEAEELPAAIEDADILVDGVFGTGFHGNLSPELQQVFVLANQSPALRVALDIPSGMNCDTGETSPNTFCADHTLCFGAYKPCMQQEACKPLLGQVTCLEIGLVTE